MHRCGSSPTGTRSVMHPIRTMALDDVLSLFATIDEAVAG